MRGVFVGDTKGNIACWAHTSLVLQWLKRHIGLWVGVDQAIFEPAAKRMALKTRLWLSLMSLLHDCVHHDRSIFLLDLSQAKSHHPPATPTSTPPSQRFALGRANIFALRSPSKFGGGRKNSLLIFEILFSKNAVYQHSPRLSVRRSISTYFVQVYEYQPLLKYCGRRLTNGL